MEYDELRVQTVIDKAARHTDEGARPSFYAISGSHLYGFPSESGGDSEERSSSYSRTQSGDLDVRGFHLIENERYLRLDAPEEQYVVNQGETTEGFEDDADIDLVSYELRKFGQLLYLANFNVIEVVFCRTEVINGVPLELGTLRALIEEELPLDVPQSSVGLAKTNYYKYLNPNKNSRPTAKKYLYVLRGLLGAQYVTDQRTITADIRELAEWSAKSDRELTEELIDAKRIDEKAQVGNDLASRADERITSLFNEIDPKSSVEKVTYKERLNDWMLKVRS